MDATIKNAHILMADDEQVNIDILARLLELEGYMNVYQTTVYLTLPNNPSAASVKPKKTTT